MHMHSYWHLEGKLSNESVFENLHWTWGNNSEDSTYISFHLIVSLINSQSPWFEWATWQPNVKRIYEIPKLSTYKVTVFRLHRRMKTFLSNSKSFRKNEHVIVTPQPSAMFFTLCKILTHHISFFIHQLRF